MRHPEVEVHKSPMVNRGCLANGSACELEQLHESGLHFLVHEFTFPTFYTICTTKGHQKPLSTIRINHDCQLQLLAKPRRLRRESKPLSTLRKIAKANRAEPSAHRINLNGKQNPIPAASNISRAAVRHDHEKVLTPRPQPCPPPNRPLRSRPFSSLDVSASLYFEKKKSNESSVLTHSLLHSDLFLPWRPLRLVPLRLQCHLVDTRPRARRPRRL